MVTKNDPRNVYYGNDSHQINSINSGGGGGSGGEGVPKFASITFPPESIAQYYRSKDRFEPILFEKIIAETMEKIKTLSTLKGGEYAGDNDRLANFRRNGNNLGLTMEQVWAVYAGKHWDALMQYIKDLGTNIVRERMEPVSGRVDDLIVYLMLFKAMLMERGEL